MKRTVNVDVSVGSAENPVNDPVTNSSEEDVSENENGMNDIGGIQPRIGPARQVRASSYPRDFVRNHTSYFVC